MSAQPDHSLAPGPAKQPADRRILPPRIMVNPKYPPGLMEEYQSLAQKQLLDPLSPIEETRLQELMDQIAAIDRADLTAKAMYERLDELESTIERIREKAQALLDTKK
jgi:hypothetical protein